MHLAEFAEVLPVGVDDRGRVVVDTRHFLLIDRHDHYHAVPLRQVLHLLGRWAVGDMLGGAIPLLVLARAEVRWGEDRLEAENLNSMFRCPFDEWQLSLQHQLADFAWLHGGLALEAHLDETGVDFGHAQLPSATVEIAMRA